MSSSASLSVPPAPPPTPPGRTTTMRPRKAGDLLRMLLKETNRDPPERDVVLVGGDGKRVRWSGLFLSAAFPVLRQAMGGDRRPEHHRVLLPDFDHGDITRALTVTTSGRATTAGRKELESTRQLLELLGCQGLQEVVGGSGGGEQANTDQEEEEVVEVAPRDGRDGTPSSSESASRDRSHRDLHVHALGMPPPTPEGTFAIPRQGQKRPRSIASAKKAPLKKKGKFPCFLCRIKNLPSRLALLAHLSKAHFLEELMLSATGHSCVYCEKDFPDRSAHAVHLGAEHAMVLGYVPRGIKSEGPWNKLLCSNLAKKEAEEEHSEDARTTRITPRGSNPVRSAPISLAEFDPFEGIDGVSIRDSSLGEEECGWRCPKCLLRFSGRRAAFLAHLVKHFKGKIREDCSEVIQGSHRPEGLVCALCGARIGRMQGLLAHLAMRHNKLAPYLSQELRAKLEKKEQRSRRRSKSKTE